MSRTVAVIWHASFSVVAGVLYFFFVLPRWPELTGTTSHTLGTVLRIVVGALIGLAALPVVFTLLRTRRPEFGTPQLALTLRTWAIALHVLAGLLIIGAAVSEIWLSLDDAGQWLFGVYGAAAATALLGISAFYLAWVAELPPPPPKPLKVKAPKQRRRRGGAEESDDEAETTEAVEETQDTEDTESTEEAAEETAAVEETESESSDEPAEDTSEDSSEDTSEGGKLRNRRPEPARRRRRRLRGGIAVED
ncbi:hypothetical protein SAMN04489835_1827 [Mycolicibacterium rutilum]|uniref:Transmembrane protein n=1 Tax=Mycolicibacterium rutilum TaxID=370526 RepID=A0A1H6JBQ1_MYCRU|nr:hypothetical protein [Mycolicibacterium rutilum]SEH59525.1 hypothetical protein SAMN04489835_1827 [Mycolicibacterium rutilum]